MTRPTLAVWKLASCDGCQLTILDCEDELLDLAGAVRIAHFTEMSSAEVAGPYDISIVEGSVTTPGDAARIRQIREASGCLIAVGACATAGGIQALRNFAEAGAYPGLVYAHPEYISSLDTSTPVADHVEVDLELHGCPIDRGQLMETVTAALAGRRPRLPVHSVCQDCKERSAVCVMVAHATPCLGPVTRAGCGALCPAVERGCYGCFGPVPDANTDALAAALDRMGVPPPEVSRLFRTFACEAPAFRRASGGGGARPGGAAS